MRPQLVAKQQGTRNQPPGITHVLFTITFISFVRIMSITVKFGRNQRDMEKNGTPTAGGPFLSGTSITTLTWLSGKDKGEMFQQSILAALLERVHLWTLLFERTENIEKTNIPSILPHLLL